MGKEEKHQASPGPLATKSQAGPAAAEKTASPAQERKGDRGGKENSYTCCGCRFPLLVALLQLLLGVAITAVAIIMATISPSLLARETPHWAGIIVCLVSVLGFVLYCITYLPDEKTSMQFIAKLLYFLLCSVGLVLSVLALAFAGHHYTQINGFTCKETDAGCLCNLDPEDPIARTFLYAGVTECSSITSTLKLYFLLQMALNLAQALVCLVGAFIMWKHRYQVFLVDQQTDSPSSQQWQKV
ncbi:hypothetical protein MATL_G00260580 [Megalops atlanticus]|uniref:Sarcospan n=1 Tax=Megalops atlanticus TaxID=7932 RepID=A0A9D3PA73_MEGAT|nr:hypothetical protein MATL_G00260580 [Megalops atlanticus]